METVELVKQFHENFEFPVNNNPLSDEPLHSRQLRIRMIFEELKELALAGDIEKTFYELCSKEVFEGAESYEKGNIQDGNNVDKVEELDAITDIQYVLDGKKCTSGLHVLCDEAFNRVHQNNMRKSHRGYDHARETILKNDLLIDDCKIVEKEGYALLYNKVGKLTKPWDHQKVGLSDLFRISPPDSLEKDLHQK